MALDDIVISVTLDQAKVQQDAQRLVQGFSQVGQQAATALLRGMEQGLNPLAIINALNKIEGVMAEFGNRVAGKSTIVIRQQMQEVTKSIDEASKSASLFGVNLERAFSRVVVYGSIYRVIGAVTQALEQSVKAAVELEFVFARLQRFGGGGAISGAAFQLGSDFGVAPKDVAGSLEISTSRFKDNAQAIDISRQALKLHLLTGEDLVTSTKSIITIMEAYKDKNLTAAKIVDSLANVTAKSKTNIVDLQSALVGAGSEMARAGVSFDKFVGIITAMQLASGASGGEITSSMTRMRARLTEAGPIKTLEQFGINTRQTIPGTNVGGSEIRDMGPILDEIGAKWNNYSKTQQQAIANALLGERAQRELVPLMNSYDQALKGAADSSNSFGEATKQVAPMLDTLHTRLAQLDIATLKWAKSLEGVFSWLAKVAAKVIDPSALGSDSQSVLYTPEQKASYQKGLSLMLADQARSRRGGLSRETYAHLQLGNMLMAGGTDASASTDSGSPGYSALDIGRELGGLSKGVSAGIKGLDTTRENIIGLKLRFEAGMGPGTYTEFLSQVQAMEKSLMEQAQRFLLTGSSGKIKTEMGRLTGHIMSGLGLVGAGDVASAFGPGGKDYQGGSEALNRFLEGKGQSTDPTTLQLIKEAKTLDTAIGILANVTKKEADATKDMLQAAKEVLAEYHAQISGITSAIAQTFTALPADFHKRADTGFTLRAQIPIETSNINILTAQRDLLQHNTSEWHVANDKVKKQIELVRVMNKELNESQNYLLAFSGLLNKIGEVGFKDLIDYLKKDLDGLLSDASPLKRLLGGAIQGAGLGTLSSGAIGKDQTGGAIGGAVGGGIATMLAGAALAPILGPLAGIVGGLLGGLLGGDDERKKKEAQDAAASKQMAELDQLKLANSHLSAIEHYTRPMSDLMEQLINAPSKFLLPIARGVLEGSITQGGVNAGFAAPHLAGGGYIEKTGLAVVHKGETVSTGAMNNTFHITGANADEISNKVVEKINKLYNQSYLRTGNTIRRNAF